MHCPKCGTENPDDMKSCRSCAQDLSDTWLPVQPPTSKTSVLAIVALVLGILSIPLVFLTGIAAIICGIVALGRIKQSSGQLKGRGLAIAGIVVPAVWLSLSFTGLLLPSLHVTKDYATKVRQRAQFHSIEAALALFKNELDGYPPSDAVDTIGQPYCGAMKLCEAMMGQDLLGFHPDSVFRADGMDRTGHSDLYPETLNKDNVKARRGPFMPVGSANPHKLIDIYGADNIGPFGDDTFVLCDTYRRQHASGVMSGMPILYYKANVANSTHDVNNPDNPQNIYNYKDNHALVGLGVPRQPGVKHPLFRDPNIFYEMTRNYDIATQCTPFRTYSYILLSAGKDGLYGTQDDIANFEMRWKPRSRR